MRLSSNMFAGLASGFAVWIAVFAAAPAQEAPLSAEELDPRVMGWMHGFPPHAEKIVIQPDSVYFQLSATALVGLTLARVPADRPDPPRAWRAAPA